jgi:hypothetical protein
VDGRDEREETDLNLEMPDQIPDLPENVARSILSTPPKDEDEWEYMKQAEVESKEE